MSDRYAATYPLVVQMAVDEVSAVPVWTFDIYGNPPNPQRDRARVVTRRRQRRSW